MAGANPTRTATVAARTEQAALAEIAALLADETSAGPLLLSRGARCVALPPAAAAALRTLARLLAEGATVALAPLDQELTTQAAADLLGVSRPYLVRLLERGELPFTRTGKHRRVRIADVLAFKQRRAAQRRARLDEIVRMSEELGLYHD